MSDLPRVESIEGIYEGQWLCFEKLHWQSQSNKSLIWERVSRKSHLGAVIIIATIKQSGEVVLIKQFRPTTGGQVLEFPAGLVDEGESVEEAALRELKEETGYTGVLLSTTDYYTTSPGFSDEKCALAQVLIDLEEKSNNNPVQQLESSEHIEVLKMSWDACLQMIEAAPEGLDIDCKVVLFALGRVHRAP